MKYTRKPIEVDAIQMRTNNSVAVKKFLNGAYMIWSDKEWIVREEGKIIVYRPTEFNKLYSIIG